MSAEAAKVMEQTRAAVECYFKSWNEQNGAKLGDTLRDDILLIDWEISAQGKYEVLKANTNIWKSFPRAVIAIDNIIVGLGSFATATCEITVELNDETSTSLRVVDLIEFDEESKIRAIRAYKQ